MRDKLKILRLVLSCIVSALVIISIALRFASADDDTTWVSIDLDNTNTLNATGYKFGQSESNINSLVLHEFDVDFNNENLILGSTSSYSYYGFLTDHYQMAIKYTIKGGYTYRIYAKIKCTMSSGMVRSDYAYQKMLYYYPDGLPNDTSSHFTYNTVYPGDDYSNCILGNSPVIINGVTYENGFNLYYDYKNESIILVIDWYAENDEDMLNIYADTSNNGNYNVGFLLNTKYSGNVAVYYDDIIYQLDYMSAINEGDEPYPYVPATPTPVPEETEPTQPDYTEDLQGINGILESIKNTLDTISSVVSGGFNTIVSTLTTIGSNIINNIVSAIQTLQGVLSSGLSSLQSAISSLISTVSGLPQTIINGISSLLSNMQNALTSAMSYLSNSITSTIQGVVGTPSSIYSTITNSGVYSELKDIDDHIESYTNDFISIYNNATPQFIITIPSCTLVLTSGSYTLFDGGTYNCGDYIESITGLLQIIHNVINICVCLFAVRYIMILIRRIRIAVSGYIGKEVDT